MGPILRGYHSSDSSKTLDGVGPGVYEPDPVGTGEQRPGMVRVAGRRVVLVVVRVVGRGMVVVAVLSLWLVPGTEYCGLLKVTLRLGVLGVCATGVDRAEVDRERKGGGGGARKWESFLQLIDVALRRGITVAEAA